MCFDDRAIFRWITVKDLNVMEFDESVKQDTPLGLLRGIKYGTESYHTLFMRLCRYVKCHRYIDIDMGTDTDSSLCKKNGTFSSNLIQQHRTDTSCWTGSQKFHDLSGYQVISWCWYKKKTLLRHSSQ